LHRAKADTQKEPEQPSLASKKNLQQMNHSFKRPVIPKFNLNEKPAPPTEEEADEATVDDLMGNYLVAGAAPQASVGTFSSKMYTEGSQVPFLEGKTVYIAHDAEGEYQSLAEECESVGGQVVNSQYQSTIDYVIVPFAPIGQVKVAKYRHIVNDLWWKETFKAAAIMPVQYFHGPIYSTTVKPLANYNIFISTYTGAERLYLITVGATLGASVKEQYIKKEKPILLCPVGEGAKYQAALKWSKSL
jgi:topoisomerase (DNA) II binding protein 1